MTIGDMKERIILTDVDGVLINWEFGFHIWMESHGHLVSDRKEYSVDRKYGLPDGIGMQQIQMFNESASIGFLPPLRDAQYYVKLLHEKWNYRFVAVTSFSDNEHAIKLREKNLVKLFGDNTFKDIICLPCGANKEAVLEDLGKKYPRHWWIEDLIENAEQGAIEGLRSLLMAHGYNYEHESLLDVTVVKDWEQIYNFVIG